MDKSNNLFKILIFPVIICGVLFASLPVYAEEGTATDIPSDTPTENEDSTDSGNEWSGEITDPANTHTDEPSTPAKPAQKSEIVIVNTTTTVTPPQKTATQTVVNTQSEENTEEPKEEIPEETKEEPQEEIKEEAPRVEYIIDLSDIIASYEDNTIEIPKTSMTEKTDLETIRKTCLSIFIFTGIIGFSSLAIWAGIRLNKLNKLNHAKKLYEEALEKSKEVKKIKITRRAN